MRESSIPTEHLLTGRVVVNLTPADRKERRDNTSSTVERGAEYLDGATMVKSFLHPLALVASERIDAMTFLPHRTGFVTGAGSFMAGIAEQVDEGEYTAEDASLETHLSPVEHLTRPRPRGAIS